MTTLTKLNTAHEERQKSLERARKAANRQRATTAHSRKIAEQHRNFKRAYDLAEKLWGDDLTNRLPTLRWELGSDTAPRYEMMTLLIDHGFARLTVYNELAITCFGEDTINPPPFTEDP